MESRKKRMYGLGLLLAAALTAGGCGSDGEAVRLEDMQQSINVDSTQGPQESGGSTAEPKEGGATVEIYQEVLRGNRDFEDSANGGSLKITGAKEMFTQDANAAMSPGQFTLVDLDGDGEPETVVAMMGSDNSPVGNLVLHCQENTVYGYVFFYREMSEIKADGSFLGSGGAANVSLCRLSFDRREYRLDEFTYSRSSYDSGNNLIMTYVVNSGESTQEEYETAYSQWEELPGVEWYDFTETDIDGMSSLRFGAGSSTGAGGGDSPQSAGGGNADKGVGSAGQAEPGVAGQISEQSFSVDLDDWGEVTFAAFEPEFLTGKNDAGQVVYGDVRFGLIKDGEIVYTFPGYNEENVRYAQQFGQVAAVAFRDYDGNGRTDILIIIEYAGVEGPNIDEPFREARVYTQEDGETVFVQAALLSEYLTYYTGSMEEMYKGLESYAKGYSVATSKTAWTVERFAREIKQFILGGNYEGLCDIISFPVTVDGVVYPDGEAFMKADFVKSPSPDFLEEMRDTPCENLFVNSQGIMMGDGSVWFAEIAGEDNGDPQSARGLKIIGINGITAK